MASHSNRNRLSLGITLLIFGLLFLLVKLGVFSQIPIQYNFLSINCFFIVAGFSFILTQPKRTLSWILLLVGIFLNSELFFGWVNIYSQFILPIVLLIAGLLMILTSRR